MNKLGGKTQIFGENTLRITAGRSPLRGPFQSARVG